MEMMVSTDPKGNTGWGSSASQGCLMSSDPQLRGSGITSKWVTLTSVIPHEWFRARQHTSLCGPTWLEDAGPTGASHEMDGEEQESRVLYNSQPEDCQEEMHFP